jgi:hypothetical protein
MRQRRFKNGHLQRAGTIMKAQPRFPMLEAARHALAMGLIYFLVAGMRVKLKIQFRRVEEEAEIPPVPAFDPEDMQTH